MKKEYKSPEFEVEMFTIYCANDVSSGWESGDNGEDVEF